jgi:hypothetical protein
MRIVDQADFTDSYERQNGDDAHYNNSYVTYLQENKGDVITKFENWKESKKTKANAKKKSKVGVLSDDVEPVAAPKAKAKGKKVGAKQ